MLRDAVVRDLQDERQKMKDHRAKLQNALDLNEARAHSKMNVLIYFKVALHRAVTTYFVIFFHDVYDQFHLVAVYINVGNNPGGRPPLKLPDYRCSNLWKLRWIVLILLWQPFVFQLPTVNFENKYAHNMHYLCSVRNLSRLSLISEEQDMNWNEFVWNRLMLVRPFLLLACMMSVLCCHPDWNSQFNPSPCKWNMIKLDMWFFNLSSQKKSLIAHSCSPKKLTPGREIEWPGGGG